MIRQILSLSRPLILSGALVAGVAAHAQTVPDTVGLAPSTPITVPISMSVTADEYVQLEVTLKAGAGQNVVVFNHCPDGELWHLDLKSLLGSAKHATLGVSIDVPRLNPLTLMPVSIDIKKSGLFGSNRSCTVTVDQIHYLSPLLAVRKYDGQSIGVTSVLAVSKTPNPTLATTLNGVLSVTGKLSGLPVASALQFQGAVTNVLGQVAISNTETSGQHFIITPGPVPADFSWTAPAMLMSGDGGAGTDIVLTARLLPRQSLFRAPESGRWTVSDVLGTGFGGDLLGNANPAGDLGGYLMATDGTDLNNLRNATTLASASVACDSVRSKVIGLGLTEADEALVLWAVTHQYPPTNGVKPSDIDAMTCLSGVWKKLPAIIDPAKIDPTPPPGPPPTTVAMKATTQVDNAFAIFFEAATWPARASAADALFGYPLVYTDTGAILMSTATLHSTAEWPVNMTSRDAVIAPKVRCYAYRPATDPQPLGTARSVMYAVADAPAVGGQNRQVILASYFANGAPTDPAKIAEIDVLTDLTADQRTAIIAALKVGSCPNGEKPAMIFGN
jgi:hypothetical protein